MTFKNTFKNISFGLFAGLLLYKAFEFTRPKVDSNDEPVKPETSKSFSMSEGTITNSVKNSEGDSITYKVSNIYRNPQVSTEISSDRVKASCNYDIDKKTQTVETNVDINQANSLEGRVRTYGSPITSNDENSRAYLKNEFDSEKSFSTTAEIIRGVSDIKDTYNNLFSPILSFFSRIFGYGDERSFEIPKSIYKKVSIGNYEFNLGAKLENRKLVTSFSFG